MHFVFCAITGVTATNHTFIKHFTMSNLQTKRTTHCKISTTHIAVSFSWYASMTVKTKNNFATISTDGLSFEHPHHLTIDTQKDL